MPGTVPDGDARVPSVAAWPTASSIPTLRTERLVLRPFVDADLDAWAAIRRDEEASRFVGGVAGREEAWLQIARYLGHWTLRGYGIWAVALAESGRLIGRAGLWYPEGWPELEVGWTLDRSVWGHGYATEAGRASVEWGRSSLGLTRIASVISVGNERSVAVARAARDDASTARRRSATATRSTSTRWRCSAPRAPVRRGRPASSRTVRPRAHTQAR